MPFGSAIIALFALPLIYWLHRFYRKPVTKVVSTLYLWPTEKLKPISGQTKHRFVNNRSYWIETLCAILLTVLLLPNPCSGDGRHHIWIVDTSASMSLTNVQSRLQAEVDNAGRYDRFTVISSGHTPVILLQFEGRERTKQHLSRLRFNQHHSQLQEAISLGRTLTSGSMDVWTDSQTSMETIQYSDTTTHRLGTPSKINNIAIVSSRWDERTVTTTISNTSDIAAEVMITAVPIFKTTGLNSSATPVTTPKNIPSTSSIEVTSTLDEGQLGFHIYISSPSDTFPIDNDVYTISPSLKPVRIATDLDRKMASAIGAAGNPAPIQKLVTASMSSSPMYADVLFSTRDIGGDENTWRLHFAPITESSWTQELLLHTPHRFLEGIQLQNTVWQFDPNRRLRGRILIESNGIPLLTEEQSPQSNRRIVHFNMGPNTSLLQQAEWPILLGNILSAKQSELSGFNQTNLQLGESLIGQGLENGTWTLKSTSNSTTKTVTEGSVTFTPTEPGVYEVHNPDGHVVHTVGLDLRSKMESTLHPSMENTIKGQVEPEMISGRTSYYKKWFWLSILGLLLFNWRNNR